MDPALLLLVPTRSYRTGDFLAAARALGVPVIVGSDLCQGGEERLGAREGEVSLDFRRPERAVERLAALASERRIGGVAPTHEGTALIAAPAAWWPAVAALY